MTLSCTTESRLGSVLNLISYSSASHIFGVFVTSEGLPDYQGHVRCVLKVFHSQMVYQAGLLRPSDYSPPDFVNLVAEETMS